MNAHGVKNLHLQEFQVRYLTLFPLFSVTNGFRFFSMGSLHKKIQSMLEFLKALFLVLHFLCYILGTLMMSVKCWVWSGIWYVAVTKIGIWTWIWSARHWTEAGSGVLISMLKKLNWFHLISLITLVLLMWKWMGLFSRKTHLLRSWGWLSLLKWTGALMLCLLLKLPPRKLEPRFVSFSWGCSVSL